VLDSGYARDFDPAVALEFAAEPRGELAEGDVCRGHMYL
jgi:hypothetical protein